MSRSSRVRSSRRSPRVSSDRRRHDEGEAMQVSSMTRRAVLRPVLVTLGAGGLTTHRRAAAAPPELRLPTDVPEERFSFEAKGLEGWTTVAGQWAVEEPGGEPSGKRV